MRLSVVVPFFDVEHYIGDCLASIARQSLRDIEVILVDDGSRDGSRAVAEEYAARDGRFRIVTQDNQGLGPARNTGMREAAGDYLTFVDSDDIVPADAFDRMLRRLDETGSDFAAGNARRFDSARVWQSFTHTEPMATDRSRTRIGELPSLAHDRMAWNKVFRRTFWEQGGYEFPAMLYEDYPVTLRAHLDATAVEVLSEPVYLWRERDAGDQSITQRVFEPANIADRVDSALQVLELLRSRPGTPRPVVETVHHHLLGADMGAIARAVALSVGTEHHDRVLGLAQRFLAALDPGVLASRSRQERLRADLVRLGDGEGLAHLIDVQDQLAPPLVSVRRWRRRRIADFEGLPRRVLRLREEDLHLHADVRATRWEGSGLHLTVQCRVSFTGPATRPAVRAWLDGDLPVEVRDVTTEGPFVLAHLVVDGAALPVGDRVLHLELDTGSVRRSGPVGGTTRGAAPFSAAWQSGPQLVVAGRRGPYTVRSLAPSHRIVSVGERLDGVSADPVPTDAVLEVAGRRSAVLSVTVDPTDPTRWSADLPVPALVDLAGLDELVAADERTFTLRLGGQPVHVDPSLAPRLLVHDGRHVRLTSGPFLDAQVHVSGPRLVLEHAGTESRGITLAASWPHAGDATLELTLPGGAALREPVAVADGRLEVTVDAAEVAERTAQAPEAARRAHHAWLLTLDTPHGRFPAHLAAELVRRLPLQVATPHGSVALTCHLGMTGRLTVRPG